MVLGQRGWFSVSILPPGAAGSLLKGRDLSAVLTRSSPGGADRLIRGRLRLLPRPDWNPKPVLDRRERAGVPIVVGAGRAVSEVEVDPHFPLHGCIDIEVAARSVCFIARRGIPERKKKAVVVAVVGGEEGQLHHLTLDLKVYFHGLAVLALGAIGSFKEHPAAVSRLDVELQVKGWIGRVILKSAEGGPQVFGDRRVGVLAKELVFLSAKLDELFSFHTRQQPGSSNRYSLLRLERHQLPQNAQGAVVVSDASLIKTVPRMNSMQGRDDDVEPR